MRATYSPEDNKLRLYPTERLDTETFEALKSRGFSWAPQQKLFVAPMWTPVREDILIALCGDIEDEDTTLAERAAQRAERFSDYSESRQSDAEQAHGRAAAIQSMIPLGQPIIIGHHSESRHRADIGRIESSMRKAVKMWDQAEYWKDRAQSAIGAAKYKEAPEVRARRIKKLTSEERKMAKTIAQASPNCNQESLERCKRWLAHYRNRLTYERAMMQESGGLASDKVNPEVGGACRCWAFHRGWSIIQKVNKVSVTVLDNYSEIPGKNFPRTIEFDKISSIWTKAQVDEARAEGRLIDDPTKRGFTVKQ